MKKQKQNSKEVKNSLSTVIDSLYGGFNGTAFGSTQVSQVDTLFKNNRWYLVSNIRQVLSELYVEHGIVQTLVDLPVDDGFRGGVEISTEQLSEEQIDELNHYVERYGVLKKIVQALKWTRLFGGGAIIIITESDPSQELKVEDLAEKSKVDFKSVDMWELYYGIKEDTYGGDLVNKEPDFYNYYGQKIHKSRVIRMEGKEAPSLIRPKLRGWGISILESVVRSYNQFLKSINLSFEVLDEFKVDVYGIDGMNNALMTSDGSQKIVKRIQLANAMKNFNNALVMDAKDQFSTKELGFSGLAEIMREIRIQIASDLRMPLTKLFGMSSAGFNSGEDDIENYNSMIESEIRSKVKFDVLRVLEICCQVLFGMIPDDLEISFKPLRIMSAEQEETIKNNKLQRLISCMEAGLLSAKEVKQSINKENLLPVKVKENDELIKLEGNEPTGVPDITLQTTPKANSKSLFEKLKENLNDF